MLFANFGLGGKNVKRHNQYDRDVNLSSYTECYLCSLLLFFFFQILQKSQIITRLYVGMTEYLTVSYICIMFISTLHVWIKCVISFDINMYHYCQYK